MKPSYTLIVTLFIALPILMSEGCKKQETASPAVVTAPPTSYTATMGGTRNWHGHYHYHMHDTYHLPFIDEDYDLPDTSFAIIIIERTTINIFGSAYLFERVDSTKGIVYFGTAWTYYMYGTGEGVAYYYNTDVIRYVRGSRSSIRDMELKKTYYTY